MRDVCDGFVRRGCDDIIVSVSVFRVWDDV